MTGIHTSAAIEWQSNATRRNALPQASDGRLDPDRLLPADPRTREIARELFALTEAMPIISPHGHVDPAIIRDDAPFADPARLLIAGDHYITRLLHAQGVPLESLGVGGREVDPRRAWRSLAENAIAFAGTASGYWLQVELSTVFGIDDALSPATADAIYDVIAARLETPELRPRALLDSFAIEVLATTDDPMDSLDAHRAIAADASVSTRVIPTFRPDAYMAPGPGFVEKVTRLAEAEGVAVDDFAGYLRALRARRAHFIAHGAVSADHGVLEPRTIELDPSDAAALYRGAVRGELDTAQWRDFTAHMLFEMARMSVDDGLVMTVHPGVLRNHSTGTLRDFGPDTGHDIPVTTTYTENLRPILERFGLDPDFHLVLFGVDETAFSRELAPLAGFYPSVYLGAPWWFLDAPDAILRFRAATTETAGFYRGSGFIDDTRAFLSIPARHDTARRLDAGFLARLVAEGRIGMPAARRIAVDLVDAIPRRAFKL
jgi:glucuronate isomerase